MASSPVYGISQSMWEQMMPHEQESARSGSASTINNFGGTYYSGITTDNQGRRTSSAFTDVPSWKNAANYPTYVGGQMTSPGNNLVNQFSAARIAAAQAEAEAKRSALLGAYQRNQQSLNSQKSSVETNYKSLANQLNTTKNQMLPQYQQQRNQSSADAATQLKRTQALNALTGKYHSGANRSQMFNVGLERANAIGNINQAQNQFEATMANNLTDAEAQRVAALNDLAGKLSLNDQQYSQGTLSLENQLASERAAAAAEAYAEAMEWANKVQQQGVDNSYRSRQLALEEQVAAQNEAYRQAQLGQSDDELAYRHAALNAGGRTGPTSAQLNTQRQDLMNRVVSGVYDKVYGKSSNAEAFRELTNNKSLILADLTASGMSASDALALYQQMYSDLNTPLE